MEIREDFKYDPAGWKSEAISLMKKSVFIILPFVVLFPLILSILIGYLPLYTLEHVGIKASAFVYFILSFSRFFYILVPCFFILFFLKRTDFGEKTNLISMFHDMKKIFKPFLDYCSILKVVFTILISIVGVFIFVSCVGIINSSEETIKGVYDTNIYSIISKTSSIACLAFFFALTRQMHESILGVVYMGYGMVNKEGASILTKKAYSKFPELSQFVMSLLSIISNTFFILIIVEIFLSLLVKDINILYLLHTAVRIVYTMLGIYTLTIIYLISRDLYGGKPVKQTVTEDIIDKNTVIT